MSTLHTRVASAVLAGLMLLCSPSHAAEYKVGILLPFSGVYAGLGSHIENGFNLGLELGYPRFVGLADIIPE